MRFISFLPFVLAVLFAALFLVEKIAPLRRRTGGILARLFVNLAFSGLAFVTAAIAVRPAALRALDWTSQSTFGLVQILHVPGWVQFLLGFLLLDLSFFYWHIINHRVPLLWRFHNVHHLDPDLDVSTGFRFHFGEVLFSTIFRVSQVTLTGVSLSTFLIYELGLQLNTLFHHSNIRLPIRLERLLNQVLVTPRMHGIHHSQVRDETNSNFGVVFPWWDKLHRTIGLNVPQSVIEIGVAGYSGPEDNRFWRALAMPFCRQRNYWRRPDGTIPERHPAVLVDKPTHLAE